MLISHQETHTVIQKKFCKDKHYSLNIWEFGKCFILVWMFCLLVEKTSKNCPLNRFFKKKYQIEEFHTVCILFITKRTTIVTTNHRIFLRKRISMGKCAPKIFFYIKPEKREFFLLFLKWKETQPKGIFHNLLS